MAFSDDLITLEKRWCAQNYASFPVVLERGSGSELWDTDGNRYLDFMGAYSASNLGHCHPRILSVLTSQAQKLDVISRAFYSNKLGVLLETSCQLLGFDMALPMNTGTEAVETAIKAARKWAYDAKGVPVDQAEIICCANNFHGRTLGAASMSSNQQTRQSFGPYAPGFKIIPFDDTEALSEAIDHRTAAFFVEPIQGEAGIVIPKSDYLRKCAEICKRRGVLLVTDEIQTGLGRTGHMLSSNAFGVQPDATVIGKSLGGGVMPVSMMLGRKDLMEMFTPGAHGSTFGGFPIAAAVASEVFSIIQDENLCDKSRDTGSLLKCALRSVATADITSIRGLGLMLAVETNPLTLPARELVNRLMRRGILCKNVNERTVRLAPPLTIDSEKIDEFIKAFSYAVSAT